jgi:S-layer homology domain
VKTKTVLIGIAALFGSLIGLAQSSDPTNPAPGPAFGTSTTSVLTLPAVTFQLVLGTEGAVDPAAARSCVSADPCTWLAGVSLPSGVRITELELEACDSDSASKVSFGLTRHPAPLQDAVPIVNNAGTGIAATPGCALFPVTVDHTVDNGANSYVAEISAAPGDNVRFGALRVSYQLQVSAPPPVATFLDVPTSDPFFQFVEALAASRITSGCGGGNFCPNEPVTRGQMAVFLARALGLSFQN